ncbi:MAG: EFR1 family ferrodoxin, partial [Paludibacteraceae bacterium]|nr:EFR1 family ferrodoxin [Paludibacteraceae bacterium]
MIYYFSATGNSQHVATRIAEALGTQAQSIETASTEIRLADGEPLGFVTPTNWNELPVLVREFIRKADIRLAKDNYVFTVATYGFLQGFVCEDARRELKRKGITMNAGFSVKMPDNWTPMFDLSDPQKVQQQVNAAEPQIDKVIAMIKAGTQGNRSHDRMPYFFRVVTDPLLTYERQTKFFGVDKSKCIG